MQKIRLVPPLFLEILQKCYKLVILGTLGTTGHANQMIGNSDVFLQTKNTLDTSIFERYYTFKNPAI